MKTQVKTVAPEILLEEYRRLLDTDEKIEALPLVVTGSSMVPFLVGGRDRVFLSRLSRPARVGDILLYRRGSGAYVLHRVYRVREDSFTMVGDAQTELEWPVERRQIFALVTKVQRKDVFFQPGDFWWEFFARVWLRLIPLRPLLIRLYGMMKKA